MGEPSPSAASEEAQKTQNAQASRAVHASPVHAAAWPFLPATASRRAWGQRRAAPQCARPCPAAQEPPGAGQLGGQACLPEYLPGRPSVPQEAAEEQEKQDAAKAESNGQEGDVEMGRVTASRLPLVAATGARRRRYRQDGRASAGRQDFGGRGPSAGCGHGPPATRRLRAAHGPCNLERCVWCDTGVTGLQPILAQVQALLPCHPPCRPPAPCASLLAQAAPRSSSRCRQRHAGRRCSRTRRGWLRGRAARRCTRAGPGGEAAVAPGLATCQPPPHGQRRWTVSSREHICALVQGPPRLHPGLLSTRRPCPAGPACALLEHAAPTHVHPLPLRTSHLCAHCCMACLYARRPVPLFLDIQLRPPPTPLAVRPCNARTTVR